MRICAGQDCDRVLYPHHSGPSGHRHCGRGLCARCRLRAVHDGTLSDYPRRLRSRDELLEDWVILRDEGYTKRQAAERLGMSYVAFERAYHRAKAAGDPRAVAP